MRLSFAASLGVATGLLLTFNAGVSAADFTRAAAGDFSTTDWRNETTMMGPPAGPPGASDNAFLGGLNVTANGQSVLSVGAGTLTLSGPFTATTLSSGLTLSATGTSGILTAQTGSAVVNGGHLVIESYIPSPFIDISNGGSVVAETLPDGSSGLVSTGGSLVVNTEEVNDLNLAFQSGGTGRFNNVFNGLDITISIDGGGSAFTVDQQFGVEAGFLDVSGGGALTLIGPCALDGGPDPQGTIIGGGGHWQGSGTTISTTQSLFVGNTTNPGFSLAIDTGAVVQSGTAFIGAQAGALGTVSLADAGTLWEVESGAMTIGQSGTGIFSISLGAHLLFDSGTILSIGFASGSHGTLTASNSDSLIDASNAIVAIGESAGSTGSVSLTNGAQFLTAQVFAVGDFGSGSLTISSLSQATFNGEDAAFLIGNVAGSSGSVSVADDGSVLSVAGPVTVGKAGAGSLSAGGGGGGTINLTSLDGLTAGALKDGLGNVVVGGTLAKLTLAGPLLLGDAGAGTLALSLGAEVTLPSGSEVNLTLGNRSGSSGTMTVDGSNFVDNLPIIIGKSGTGSFSALNEASVQMFGFTAPFSSGAKATVTVDNSDWVNSGNIYLGGLSPSDPPSTLLVTNNATMRVTQRMTIFQSGTATINTGGKMAVGSGDYGPAGSLRVSTGGILSGYGRVQGQVIVAAGGKIYPGKSPGILTVEGAYQQEAGSTYSAEIGGTTVGTGFDQISVTGAASLGGTLQVRLVNGFTPSVGQTFRIVNAASVSGAFAIISQPSQAGISLTSDATGVTATITSVIAGAPVISSATTVNTAPGTAFSYQITATNNPTSFGATNLPAGLTVNQTSGLISGTPTVSGAFIVPINANNAAGSGQADLTLVVDPIFGVLPGPPSNLLNISTRLTVQTGDNVLIGGFIITGTDPKEVIVRGIGPSLGTVGVSGFLADPVLELHKSDGTIVTNDNWKDTQQTEITAAGFAPGSELESAILATLEPGAYTAILRGKNDGTGIGLVEAYDLDQAADSTLANISTRGLVETGDNVMIGGFIIGGGGGGASTVVLRAIGPSLSGTGVANALQNPTLELHDVDGAIIATNDDWIDGPDQQTISDDGLAPTDDAESALLATLAPGAYTAIVRGAGDTTGVGLVEAYNLQ